MKNQFVGGQRRVTEEALLMIAGVMVVPGFGTSSRTSSRSKREKGKAAPNSYSIPKTSLSAF